MDWIDNGCECGSQDGVILFVARDLNFGATEEKSNVHMCKRCASVYPTQVPSEQSIGSAYEGYYTIAADNPGRARVFLRRLMNSTRREYNDRGLSDAATSILDYGCGGGEYLAYLNEKGCAAKLFGTDLIEIEDAESRGFRFERLEKVGSAGEIFDHITLSHVIEHVHDARLVVRAVFGLTSHGGKVWISTPNSESLLITCFGKYARDIDFPRHIHVFSKKCLLGILEDVGFDVEAVSPPRINTVLNFLSCLKNVWRQAEMGKLEKVRISLVSGLRLFVHLISPTESRDACAGEIVVLCRKA